MPVAVVFVLGGKFPLCQKTVIAMVIYYFLQYYIIMYSNINKHLSCIFTTFSSHFVKNVNVPCNLALSTVPDCLYLARTAGTDTKN